MRFFQTYEQAQKDSQTLKMADEKVASFIKEAEKSRGVAFESKELPYVTAVIQGNIGTLMLQIPRNQEHLKMLNGVIFGEIEEKLSEVFPDRRIPDNIAKNKVELLETALGFGSR